MTSLATLNNNSIVISHSIDGSGRSFVIVAEHGSVLESYAELLAKELNELGQICIIKIRPVEDDWRKGLEDLIALLDSAALRSSTFITFGDAAVLVQAICLKKLRLVRTLVFIDAATRAHPSRFVKFVKRIEGFLPLGLPFRSDFPGFDGKPFLQRIRCPVLVGLSPIADEYRKEQAQILTQGMPTSFLARFSEGSFEKELGAAIREFQGISARCPQKNLHQG